MQFEVSALFGGEGRTFVKLARRDEAFTLQSW